MDLRSLAESDLATTLEGDFGMQIILTSPADVIAHSSNYASATLRGQVLYDSVVENPETGGQVIINKPVISVRRSSLSVLPSDVPSDTNYYKNWFVHIPKSVTDSTLEHYKIETPPQQGKSIGFMVMFLTRISQS